ncbi:protoheme IX farnesyltransferase [Chloroflexota bacterium]
MRHIIQMPASVILLLLPVGCRNGKARNINGNLPGRSSILGKVKDYVEVLKPLPTILLTFIGLCAAIIAGEGQLSPKLFLVLVAILLASAGANGLTNYLDRNIDARMRRTRGRALPSGRIYPPYKVLPLVTGLIITGLVLTWQLHPFAFLAGLVGTIVAATWRKKVTCVYPQGVIASCAPVLMGWFAMKPIFGWEIALLCILIGVWLPLHVWSLIIANRDDYQQAGQNYFPVNIEVKDSVKVLLLFSLALYAASIALYFIGSLAWLYLLMANILGIAMVYAGIRLVVSSDTSDAWRLYRLSSFPYLGLLFLIMCLDIWLLG